MTVEQLSKFLPHFPIKDILYLQSQEIGMQLPVIEVHYPAYMAKIDATLASVPAHSLLAYQYWQAFRQTDSLWTAS